MPDPLLVRMGVHTGEADLRDGDYYGTSVNRAARDRRRSAHGGQIVVSHATEELVRDHLPARSPWIDLGEHRLRDLARPERVFQVRAPGPRPWTSRRCDPSTPSRATCPPARRRSSGGTRSSPRSPMPCVRRPDRDPHRRRRRRQDPARGAGGGRGAAPLPRRWVALRAGGRGQTPTRWHQVVATAPRRADPRRAWAWGRASSSSCGPSTCCWCSTTVSTSSTPRRISPSGSCEACPEVRLLATSREGLAVRRRAGGRRCVRSGLPGEGADARGHRADRRGAASSSSGLGPRRPDFSIVDGGPRRGGRGVPPPRRHPARHRAGGRPHGRPMSPSEIAAPARRALPAAHRWSAQRGRTPPDAAGHRRLVVRPPRRRGNAWCSTDSGCSPGPSTALRPPRW